MRRLLLIPIIIFVTGLVVPALADSVAGSTITSVDDTPEKFTAAGRLVSTDSAVATVAPAPPAPGVAAQPVNNGLDTEGFDVVGPPPGNWTFKVQHKTLRPWQAAGADDLQLCIEGVHRVGPHQGPVGRPDDVDPQALPQFCSKAKDHKFGAAAARSRSAYKREKHTIVGGGNHIDHYGVIAVIGAMPVATGNQVDGIYQVGGVHGTRKTRPSDLYGYAVGSSLDAGSTVAYDSRTKSLTFTIGEVDILDDSGGDTRSVDGSYWKDAALRGTLAVSDLELIEQVDDGTFQFGPGTVTFTDPEQNYELEGTFAEYLIDETVGGKIVTSYALLDTMTSDNFTDFDNGGSEFLDNFVATAILRTSMPNRTAATIAGIDFTFLTPTDLVAETAGFTESAELPVTVLIALNSAGEFPEDEVVQIRDAGGNSREFPESEVSVLVTTAD